MIELSNLNVKRNIIELRERKGEVDQLDWNGLAVLV